MLHTLSWNFICQLYLCKAREKCLMRRKVWPRPQNKGMRYILEHKKSTMSHMSIIIRYRIPKYEAMAAWTTVITKAPDTFAERWTNQPAPNRKASAEWHVGAQWVLVGCAEEYKRHWKPYPMSQSGCDPEQDSPWGLGSVLCTAKSWTRVPSPT